MLVFYHIPKTAGTSSRRVIEAWFPKVYRDYDYRPAAMGTGKDAGEVCVIGHFAARLVGHELALLDLMPGLRGPNPDTVFTVLREPLDHAVSAYYHMRDIDNDRLGGLDEFLENGHPFQSSIVLGISGTDCIAPALDSFAVTGDSLDLQKTFDVLADRLAKPRLEVPTVRVGTRDTQVVALNASERSRFERMWPLDYEIYEAARDRLKSGAAAANSAHRQFFPHAARSSMFVDAALKRQNETRKSWSERPGDVVQAKPVLAPEIDMFLAKKDARIKELEQKVTSIEERGRSLVQKLDEQSVKHKTDRDRLQTKLEVVQSTNKSLKASIEKQQRKVDFYKKQVEFLTSKLPAGNGATTGASVGQIDHARTLADRSTRRAPDALPAAALAKAATIEQRTPDWHGSISGLKTILDDLDSMVAELNAR